MRTILRLNFELLKGGSKFFVWVWYNGLMNTRKVRIGGTLYELEIDEKSKEGKELDAWLDRYDISKGLMVTVNIIFLVAVLLHFLAFSSGIVGWVFLIPFVALITPLSFGSLYLGYVNYLVLTVSSWIFYYVSKTKLEKLLKKYE